MSGLTTGRSKWTAIICLAVCAGFAANALLFTARTAIPLPIADAWYFLEAFVRPAVEGKLAIVDFFVQRSAGDHAQPLQKLLLLADLKFWGLDFRLEALFGIAIGVLSCLGLAMLVARSSAPGHERVLACLGGCAIFAVGLSLNSTNVYTWYLVGLGWLSIGLALVYWWLLGERRSGWKAAAYAGGATLLLALVLDELAIPAVAAVVISLLVRDRFKSLRSTLPTLLAGVGALGLGRWLLTLMSPVKGAAAATGGSLGGLVEVLQRPDSWKLVVGPLADSVVHQIHLIKWFPALPLDVIQVSIATVLLSGHFLFWRRALVGRNRPPDRLLVVAVAMMLFFYASIAGIALSRVPQFGVEYVHQPRYILIYQLNIVALLVMFTAPFARSDGSVADGGFRWPAAIATTSILLLQLPLSIAGWESAPYIRNYTRVATSALLDIGRDPQNIPATGCPDILKICSSPPAARAATMEMLQDHRLNIYSTRFRGSNGMEASPESPARNDAKGNQIPAAACKVEVLKWGPTTITRGQSFNKQPDGRSAYWVQVGSGASDFVLEFAGMALHTVRNGEVVTFLHSDKLIDHAAKNDVLGFDLVCGGRRVDGFEVAVRSP